MAIKQQQMDPAMMDMAMMAQLGQSMGLNEPPPMAELMKLLDIATGLHTQEQDVMLKQQALENERRKAEMMSPEMLQTLMMRPEFSSPEASRRLIEQAAPGVLPEAAPTPQSQLPNIGQPAPQGPSKLPKGRLDVKSQKAFMGYEPPPGSEDVEAVLDEQGNIINFVRRGTTENVADFVPTAESVGGWGASKYAVAQQMKELGRFLGLAPRPQTTRPY